MLAVVALLLHKYVFPPDAVSVTLPPEQKVVGPPAVIAGAGTGFTETFVIVEVLMHPEAFATDTQ